MKKTFIIFLCIITTSALLSGCGLIVTNPMQYMQEKDSELLAGTGSEEETSSVEDVPKPDNNILIVESSKGNNMTTKDMLELSKEINTELEDSHNIGLVLLHEKSTFDELTYFLSLTINSDKPIIAIPVTDDRKEYPEEVALAKKVINNEAVLPDTESGITEIIKNTHTFDISKCKELPLVSILFDYMGNDGSLLESSILYNDGLIILSSSYDGSLSYSFSEIINNYGSAVPATAVVVTEKNGLKSDNGNVFFTEMSPSRARLLMMLCLYSGYDISKIKDIFES